MFAKNTNSDNLYLKDSQKLKPESNNVWLGNKVIKAEQVLKIRFKVGKGGESLRILILNLKNIVFFIYL